ncbi:hypothetical protein [Vibrio chagasii]|uniref:hypothetical protein n=1 Tax=Vibrio chagasii TaxID=170679 RepID=UPI003BB783B9
MNKDPREIMVELHEKFNNNFTVWKAVENIELDRTLTLLKGTAAIGDLLRESSNSKHHEICCKIYDEIFSDGVSALYLASTSMDKPANIVLRRVVELGVAALYLWDMPHMAHSWNSHDQNLSFTEMLNHINSKGYRDYVSLESSIYIGKELIPSKRFQKIYGDLSDVVHGKITTFESNTPQRFQFVEQEWLNFIVLIEEILECLLRAFVIRYDFKEKIYNKLPLLKKELDL